MRYKIRSNKSRTGVNYFVTIPKVIMLLYGWTHMSKIEYKLESNGVKIVNTGGKENVHEK
jgi:hypothetical protein